MKEKTRVWFSTSLPRQYFRVPIDTVFSEGPDLISSMDAKVKRVNLKDLASYHVSKSDIFDSTSAHSSKGEPSPKVEHSGSSSDKDEKEEIPDIEDTVGSVLGLLGGLLSEGLSIGEELLDQVNKEEAIAIAQELAEEAMELASTFVTPNDQSDDPSESESITGLNIRSLLKQGLQDMQLTINKDKKDET